MQTASPCSSLNQPSFTLRSSPSGECGFAATQSELAQGDNRERREFVAGLGVVAAATAVAPGTFAQDHSQHSHGGGANDGLVRTSSACVSTGDVCLTHCVDLLLQGDKSMADCAASVRQMLAVCNALLSLAAQDAPALRKIAAVALETCKSCEAECLKHKSHAPCQACADACAACAAECKKVA